MGEVEVGIAAVKVLMLLGAGIVVVFLMVAGALGLVGGLSSLGERRKRMDMVLEEEDE